MNFSLKALGTWFFMGARRRDLIFTMIVALACAALWFLPTGFETRLSQQVRQVSARVVETQNDLLVKTGMVISGPQVVWLVPDEGAQHGQKLEAANYLVGKLELDKLFAPGDRVLASITEKNGRITDVRATDYYRLGIERWALGAFALLLATFGGFTGVKALLSFVFTALTLWKVLVPGLLDGWDPILLSLPLTGVLSLMIIFLVAGVTRRGVAALMGTLTGLLVTCALAMAWADGFAINGAVRPFAETLLYSGYPWLNLDHIMIGSVFLASSGAVMDLSMDIASAMAEITVHHPGITAPRLFKSGLTVGRAVIGTMTTTLLLAYSGSFVAMMMTFMARGITLSVVLNTTYVSSEIYHTLAGSFGLVTVAPLTAAICALLYPGHSLSEDV